MTAEEEEDVIKIDQANIAPCDTPALACVAFVACVILSSNTLARSSKILRWTLNLLDSSRLSGTCRTYRTLIQDLYVLNILESDTSLKAFEAAMFAHFFFCDVHRLCHTATSLQDGSLRWIQQKWKYRSRSRRQCWCRAKAIEISATWRHVMKCDYI